MATIAYGITYLFPLLGLILLITGISIRRVNYVLAALWFALIALLFQYQMAGGEILGSYFNYKNASIYTLNLFILVVALCYSLLKLPVTNNRWLSYMGSLFAAFFVVCAGLLATNLWINACFIENRLAGTAVMQVISFRPIAYCSYRYIFYRVDSSGQISYLCPNYYGLIPKVDQLEVAPDFLATQLGKITQQLPRSLHEKPIPKR